MRKGLEMPVLSAFGRSDAHEVGDRTERLNGPQKAGSQIASPSVLEVSTAITLGELRCAFVATSRARQVRDRLPEGRWRPSIYWSPYWQSLKTASDAVCCLVPSRKSSDVGSSKLSRVARLFNN